MLKEVCRSTLILIHTQNGILCLINHYSLINAIFSDQILIYHVTQNISNFDSKIYNLGSKRLIN